MRGVDIEMDVAPSLGGEQGGVKSRRRRLDLLKKLATALDTMGSEAVRTAQRVTCAVTRTQAVATSLLRA